MSCIVHNNVITCRLLGGSGRPQPRAAVAVKVPVLFKAAACPTKSDAVEVLQAWPLAA
ncbi:hypothetical protein [Azohydromonas aeria]|jgi:hypothetical protein|uniref:hypothetical protein n=1 Tax=Azohydromonas aeria TaxID=2590212 RepID=UPI0012FA301B|nr:hypothetical protein [Azohydromonas aeria]